MAPELYDLYIFNFVVTSINGQQTEAASKAKASVHIVDGEQKKPKAYVTQSTASPPFWVQVKSHCQFRFVLTPATRGTRPICLGTFPIGGLPDSTVHTFTFDHDGLRVRMCVQRQSATPQEPLQMQEAQFGFVPVKRLDVQRPAVMETEQGRRQDMHHIEYRLPYQQLVPLTGTLSPPCKLPQLAGMLFGTGQMTRAQWAYPVHHCEGKQVADDFAPWEVFLNVGGFLFFDSLDRLPEICTLTTVPKDHGGLRLRLVGPHKAPQCVANALRQLGRLQPVTLQQLRTQGAGHFSWLLANESVCGVKLNPPIPHGGFLYTTPNGKNSVYFYCQLQRGNGGMLVPRLFPRLVFGPAGQSLAACDDVPQPDPADMPVSRGSSFCSEQTAPEEDIGADFVVVETAPQRTGPGPGMPRAYGVAPMVSLAIDIFPPHLQYCIHFSGTCRVFGTMSPTSPVNLPSYARLAACIPETCTHFAFLYPIPADERMRATLPADIPAKEQNFLNYGGFAYFSDGEDNAYVLNQVNALQPGEGLYFTEPQQSGVLQRLQKVLASELKEQGYDQFVWLPLSAAHPFGAFGYYRSDGSHVICCCLPEPPS